MELLRDSREIIRASAKGCANLVGRRLQISALLTMAMIGPACAGTVLERVLSYADHLGLNTTLANISETQSPFTSVDFISSSIDGSITNLFRYDGRPSVVTDIFASEMILGQSTVDLNTVDALGIGAVNTGGILLDHNSDQIAGILTGTNASVQQAIAASSHATSQRSSPFGSSADTSGLVINMASNSLMVQGRVDNILHNLGGSIEHITATAIGAVNTSEIQNGITGIVNDITGPAIY
ncbi:hypothetical protein AAFO90_23545 [Phaeobacter sp. CAU 1743]|uniref:hypothetical protein n=1 Tax=Phaeobacter sp. CAU 1743 TaxID=3140367 RepID=UPI00325B79AE